jgi:hypothetical protein
LAPNVFKSSIKAALDDLSDTLNFEVASKHLGAFAKLREATVSFVLFVRFHISDNIALHSS